MSTRDFLLSHGLKTKVLKIEGQEIVIKQMSAAKRLEWSKIIEDSNKEDGSILAVIFSVMDGDNLAFTIEDKEAIKNNFDTTILDEITRATLDLNGLNNNPIEEAEKN